MQLQNTAGSRRSSRGLERRRVARLRVRGIWMPPPVTKSIGDNAIRQRSWRIPTRDRRSHAPAHRPLILFQNVATPELPQH